MVADVVREGLVVGGDVERYGAVNALGDNALVEGKCDREGGAAEHHLAEDPRGGPCTRAHIRLGVMLTSRIIVAHSAVLEAGYQVL